MIIMYIVRSACHYCFLIYIYSNNVDHMGVLLCDTFIRMIDYNC